MEFLSELIRHHSLDLSDPLVRNSVFISLSRLIDVGFGFLFWLVAAHVYSVSDVGIGTALISVMGIVLLISRLGFDISLMRFVPIREPSTVINTSIWVTSISCLIVSIIALIFVPLISPSLNFLNEFTIIFIIITLASSFTSMIGTALIAVKKPGFRLIQNFLMGIRIPLLVPLVILGGVGIFFSIGIAYVISAIFGLLLLGKMISLKYSISRDYFNETFRFNSLNYLSTLIQNLPALIIPLIILNISGSNDVALFAIALAISNLVGIIPDSMGTSFFVEGSHGRSLREGFFTALTPTYFAMIPAIVIILLWGNLILLLFGEGYVVAFSILGLLAISKIFQTIYNIFIQLQIIRWKSESGLITNFFGTGLLIALSYILMIKFGLTGIGYAFVISYAFMALIIVIFAKLKRWI